MLERILNMFVNTTKGRGNFPTDVTLFRNDVMAPQGDIIKKRTYFSQILK